MRGDAGREVVTVRAGRGGGVRVGEAAVEAGIVCPAAGRAGGGSGGSDG